MATNKKEYKVKIQIGGEKDSSLDKAFSQTKRELDNLYRFSKRTNQSFLSSVNKMDAFADKTFSFMAKGAAAASAGITGALAASTAAGASFESQMSTVQAISQASETEMARLKALAKQMGIETKFSARSGTGAGIHGDGWLGSRLHAGRPSRYHESGGRLRGGSGTGIRHRNRRYDGF